VDARLKRWFWVWHFWTGLIAGPILIVLAVTGAIYIFKSELELWWYEETTQADFDIETLRLQSLCDDAMTQAGDGYKPYGLEIETDTGRAPAFLLMADDGSYKIRRVYLDPNSQSVLGELPESNWFTITLAIHRRLMAGTLGRVLTELTTGWTIAITLMGLLLWWPRSWKKLRGVLVPRLRGKRYVTLRDLHSIGGALSAALVIVIAVTGLLFALVWGGVFQAVGFVSGQFDVVVSPPQSISDTGQPDLGIDQVLERARDLGVPTARMSIALAQSPTDPITIESGDAWGPSVTRIVHLDRASGEVLADQNLLSLPPMAIYTQWCYPLHVGSVGGMATKILWLIASIVLSVLPILGFAMWLVRRKSGTFGVPKQTEAAKPHWLILFIVAIGIALPTVGVSMLMVAGVGWLSRCRRSVAALSLFLVFTSFGDGGEASSQTLDAKLRPIFEQSNLKGCSIAVLKDDVVDTITYGTSATQANASPDSIQLAAMEKSTRLAGGSISKLVTAVMMLRAVELGKFQLTDRVTKYLPGVIDSPKVANLPEADEVTIAMLLEHTAGLNGSSLRDFAANEVGTLPTQYVESRRPFSIQWTPGKHFSYANDGPVVAAAILESVFDDDFDSIVNRELFVPLEMQSSHFSRTAYPRPRSFQRDQQTLAEAWLMPIRPAGAIITTPTDMIQLARMLLSDGKFGDGNSFISPQLIQRMRRAETSMAARHGVGEGCYGLGSFPFILENDVWHGHYGKTEAFDATVGIHLPTKTAFVLMVNSNDGRSTQTMRETIASHLTDGQPSSFQKEPKSSDTPQNTDFAGGLFVGASHKMASRRWLFSLLEARWVEPIENGLRVSPLLPIGSTTDYVPVNEKGGYRSESIPIATATLIVDDSQSGMIWWVDGESYRNESPWLVGLQVFAWLGGIVTACIVLAMGPLVACILWIISRRGKLSRYRPAMSEVMIWLAAICLVLFWYFYVVIGVFGISTEAANLGRWSIESIMMCGLTIGFATFLTFGIIALRGLPTYRRAFNAITCFFMATHAALLVAHHWLPWCPG